MPKYHNFSEGFKSTDMLEIHQVLNWFENLWYIADITDRSDVNMRIVIKTPGDRGFSFQLIKKSKQNLNPSEHNM